MQDAIDITYEQEFEDRVRFYLTQPGHPAAEDIQELVGEPRFTNEKDDPLLRARLFLVFMTGSDLVSTAPNFHLTVRRSIRAMTFLTHSVSSQFSMKHRGSRAELPHDQEPPLPSPVSVSRVMDKVSR